MWPQYLQPQIHFQDSYSINWPSLHYRSLTQQFQAELVVKKFSFSARTLTHCILMNASTIIYLTDPFIILEVPSLFCRLYSILMENYVSKQCRPRSGATLCGA